MMIEPKKIVRSRRKTIALVVDTDGELIVRAPFFASMFDIREFIDEKHDWIIEKSIEMKKRMASRPILTMEDGDTIPYLGKECVINRGFVKSVYFDGESFLVPDSEKAKDKLITWYKKEALRVFSEKVDKYAAYMGVEPCGISITSAKTRWGSCTYQNKINFSWRLLMCPSDVVDYVVVHELCHIYHKNHSRDFWKEVASIDHSYKAHEKWLKENERLMDVI